MVQGKWYPMNSDITTPLSLRKSVFGAGRDTVDEGAWQVVVSHEDVPVGAARLWWQDGAFRIGYVGVIENERGKGFGDLLVRLLLFKALTHNASVICLTAPKDVVPFFEKYGFVADAPEQDGMVAMYINASDVQLSHCGGDCENCQSRTEKCTPRALR